MHLIKIFKEGNDLSKFLEKEFNSILPATKFQKPEHVKTDMKWSYVQGFYLQGGYTISSSGIAEAIEPHHLFSLVYNKPLAWKKENALVAYKEPPL